LHPASNGQGRNGVRRGYDRPQYKTDGPIDIHQRVDRSSHHDGCEHNAANRQQRDRAQIELELAPTHLEGRGVDERRQYEEQDQFRSKLYTWEARHKREQHTRQDEENCGRDFQSVGKNGHCRYYRQQQHQNLYC
jgi:hypothetical protein